VQSQRANVDEPAAAVARRRSPGTLAHGVVLPTGTDVRLFARPYGLRNSFDACGLREKERPAIERLERSQPRSHRLADQCADGVAVRGSEAQPRVLDLLLV
jgi:hypothetical protein